MRRKERISSAKALLLLLIALFVGIGGTLWFYAVFKVVSVEEWPISMKIPTDKRTIGFSVDPELNFGKVPPGWKSEREMTTGNPYEFPVRVDIYIRGNVSPFISISNNSYVLAPKEVRKIKFFSAVPSNLPTPKGEDFDVYNGTAIVKYIKV